LKSALKNIYGTAVCVFFMLFLLGCNMSDEDSKSSTDMAALRNTVNLDIPAKSIRWEIFGSPECTGMVPGPTDYMTLIAELEPSDAKTFSAMPAGDKTRAVPESVRRWLGESFRSMLEKHKYLTIDLSVESNYRPLKASLKSTGKPVDGFICSDGIKFLVYLNLAGAEDS
jgi:hypothetical protein